MICIYYICHTRIQRITKAMKLKKVAKFLVDLLVHSIIIRVCLADKKVQLLLTSGSDRLSVQIGYG